MTDSSKSVAVGGNKLDRLTNLPINVVHQIQDHMSIEDAARMSVLSRAWRYVWASNPKLIFDTKFCTKRLSSNVIEIISTILFQHRGSVKTFLVDISVIHSSQHSVVDAWMQFLSRNGLVNLTIQNRKSGNNAPYKLPSYVNDVELERLVLSNCIFRQPCSFRGFHKLKELLLTRVSFKLDVVTSSLWMPNLERLVFINCTGDLHLLNIYAPELLVLNFSFCGIDFVKLSTFMDCEKLEQVGIAFRKNVSQNRRDDAIKLTHLLSSWPSLRKLILDRYVLKFFARGNEVERLPASLNRLRYIRLHNFDFDSENKILPLLLTIFRSCPNLKKLEFCLGQREKGDMETYVNRLEGPEGWSTKGLNKLQKLKIKGFHGSTTELRFVRFILLSAPLLRKATLLIDNTSVDQSQSLKKELMQFPRASPKLKIKCKPQSEK